MKASSRVGVVAALAALWCAVLAEPVLACPVCFGASDAPQVQGMRMAIFALMGITVGVLGAFAAFFVYLMRRARMTAGTTTVAVQPAGAHGRSY